MFNTDRRPQYEKLAYELDMFYEEKDEWGLDRMLSDFRLFRRGFKGRIRHILRKQDPMMQYDLRIFDYRYLVHTGKATVPINQTVFFLESRYLGLPEFLMQPETLFHKIGEFLGAQDIDFEEFPEFSRQYQLRGEDEEFIRANFQESILHFFSLEKGWSMEGVGFYLLLYKRKKLFSPRQIHHLYRKGHEIYAMLHRKDVSRDWLKK